MKASGALDDLAKALGGFGDCDRRFRHDFILGTVAERSQSDSPVTLNAGSQRVD
jgi:hypothetical protein